MRSLVGSLSPREKKAAAAPNSHFHNCLRGIRRTRLLAFSSFLLLPFVVLSQLGADDSAPTVHEVSGEQPARSENPTAAKVAAEIRKMEDAPAALEMARRHLEQFPEHAEVRAAMAGILVNLQRFDEAEPIYAQLFEQGFDDDSALFTYVTLLIHLEREADALQLIEREAERRPTPLLRLWEGQTARIAGEFRKAEEIFRSLAETRGWHPRLYREMIALFQAEGDHHQALEWIEREEEAFDLSFDLLMDRGNSLLALGQLKRARYWFEQALERRKNDPDARASIEKVARLLAGEGQGDPGSRPNIVFIFSDDHALRAISAYGDALNETPAIDRLADEGVIFTRSYNTNSICGPSRASILTGMHSHRNGFMRNDGTPFDGAQTTFPQLLQEAGYQTALLGKWHLKSTPTGFDHFEIFPGQGNYYNPDFIQMNGERKRYEGYSTDLVTEMAIDWLNDKRSAEKPFLLMMQHKAPHRTFSPALRHLELYTDRDIPEPETLFDDYENRSALLKDNEMEIGNHLWWEYDLKVRDFNPEGLEDITDPEYARMTDAQRERWDAHFEPLNQQLIARYEAGEMSREDLVRWKYQRYIKNYLRTVEAVDESVGRVLDYLDENGLSENTIVIYSSDQGFYLGEHGWFDKRWMFEESFAMPFIIRWPGIAESGRHNAQLIQNIDYAPTLLEAAGVSIPDRMQGRSLRPLLTGETNDWRDSLFYAYYETTVHHVPEHFGVTDGRYKLMWFPLSKEWNLFDLVEDPQELRSVHADPAYAEVMERMQGLFESEKKKYLVSQSTVPTSRNEVAWWRERHQEKVREAREKAGNVELVFVGDSITHRWERDGEAVWAENFNDSTSINLGFAGDRTEHVLWRLHNGEWPAELQPKIAVIMIGTNNTGNAQPPSETADGIELIVGDIHDRAPETDIVLLGIFPRGATPEAPKRQRNEVVNQMIRELDNREKVHYMDIGDVFLDDDGNVPESVMPDHLHPNEEGYRRWAETLMPRLEALGLQTEIRN